MSKHVSLHVDRTLSTASQFIGLCTSEAKFHKELKRLSIPRSEWPVFVPKRSGACVHSLVNNKGRGIQLVCINVEPHWDGIDIAALLVHEAVHIWQEHCNDIHERNPSIEFEAYAIQAISDALMRKYKEQTKCKTKK